MFSSTTSQLFLEFNLRCYQVRVFSVAITVRCGPVIVGRYSVVSRGLNYVSKVSRRDFICCLFVSERIFGFRVLACPVPIQMLVT